MARKSTGAQNPVSQQAHGTAPHRSARPTGHVERERKYEGDAAAALPSLAGASLPAGKAGPVSAVAADSESLRAVYYDTPDLRLLARRITLRRRTGGHDAGWHLKLPAADGNRLELQLPLDASTSAADPDAPRDVPPELLARVRAYVREGRLAPVARLATERRRTLLTDSADRTLVELADDSVTAQALDPTGAVRHAESWHEVEAELVDGDTPLLDAVERRLLDAGLHRSPNASKLARALGPAASARPEPEKTQGPAPDSIGALLTALLRTQIGQLVARDAEVRRDVPDAVHQMRVSARRLRSTLRAHERLLRLDEVAGLEEELRWLGHALGGARDHEVLGERLLRDLDALEPGERPGPMRRRLRAWSHQGYRTAWQQTVRELEGPRYFALLDALDALAARPPLRARANRPAAKEARRLLAREQRRTCRRVDAALALAPGTAERDQAMHAARRAAKRARYAGEGAGQPRFAKAMKNLQTVLGERQDAFMAEQALPGLAEAAHRAGEPGFGYGILYARQREAITLLEAELPALEAAARAVRVK